MLRDKTKHLNCEHLESLIAKNHTGKLNRDEQQWLDHHLVSCEECGYFAEILRNLHAGFSPEKALVLQPNPSIHLNLRKQLAEKAFRQNERRLSNKAFDFFKKRIPVYQAAFAILACLMIVLYTNKNDIPANGFPANQALQSIQFVADTTQLQDTLQFKGNDDVGRSMKDDSLLARFFYSVM